MKVSKEQVAASRARILEIAAERFREHGFDGIGVADLMAEAGLTHGGFYGYFESKQDLAAQACAHAIAESVRNFDAVAASSPRSPLATVLAQYLSLRHRDEVGRGCLLPALAAEIPRNEGAVQRAFTDGFEAYVEAAMSVMPETDSKLKRTRALATLAGLVGAVILARAVDDKKLSEEILRATRKGLSDRSG